MSYQKLTTPTRIAFDLALTGGFFLFMTAILRPFVPGTENPLWIWFWAGFTALPVTGVFWFAVQMFRVTLTDQIRRNREKKGA